MLVHGNATRDAAMRMSSIIQKHLTDKAHTKPLLTSQLTRQREYQLKDGKYAQDYVEKSDIVKCVVYILGDKELMIALLTGVPFLFHYCFLYFVNIYRLYYGCEDLKEM